MKVYESGAAGTSGKLSTGTFEASIPNDTPFNATDVVLKLLGGEKPGGMIIAHEGKRLFDIGFPQGLEDSGDEVTQDYPKDFSNTDLRWDFQPASGDRVVAKSGTITVRFSAGKKEAEGTFQFDTTEVPPRNITGLFKVKNA